TEEEAKEAIEELDGVGDIEGKIPYDREAEFLVQGQALPGMSGGGVFDQEYRQVGVAVRASFAGLAVQYVRIVRMSFLVTRMKAALAKLHEAEREKVLPYLEEGFDGDPGRAGCEAEAGFRSRCMRDGKQEPSENLIEVSRGP